MNTAAGRSPDRAICIVGPTGAGKTAASLVLAGELGGTILNLDSRQLYRGTEIVSAHPSPEEQAQAPHRLFGVLDPPQAVSAGDYQRMAEAVEVQLRDQGRAPIYVGGTGLYLRALEGGLAPAPDVPPEIRAAVLAELAAAGPETMHARLAEVDPVTAARLAPRDGQRISRALEIWRATGKPLSWWHEQGRAAGAKRAFVKIGIALERETLNARLDARVDAMLEAGALDETRRALARWPLTQDRLHPGFESIGCRELIDHLAGRTSLDEAVELWKRRTRRYAKRQMTWFKADPEIVWFAPDRTREMLALAS